MHLTGNRPEYSWILNWVVCHCWWSLCYFSSRGRILFRLQGGKEGLIMRKPKRVHTSPPFFISSFHMRFVYIVMNIYRITNLCKMQNAIVLFFVKDTSQYKMRIDLSVSICLYFLTSSCLYTSKRGIIMLLVHTRSCA